MVRGDDTCAYAKLAVIPKKSKCVVFSINGSFTSTGKNCFTSFVGAVFFLNSRKLAFRKPEMNFLADSTSVVSVYKDIKYAQNLRF